MRVEMPYRNVVEYICRAISAVQRRGIAKLWPGKESNFQGEMTDRDGGIFVYGVASMEKYKHLTLQEREEIEHGLENQESFRQISRNIGKDPSTIAKEVKGHFTVVESGGYGRPYNPCALRRKCSHCNDLCAETVCKRAKCSLCAECFRRCPDFQEELCVRLNKPPYVCNGCKERPRCTLRKHLYRAKAAQDEYMAVQSESRQGIVLHPKEVERIDDIVSPLVKKGQSLHHICVNNADKLMVSEKTLYNYLGCGLFSAKSIDLPRKVRYRPRKHYKPLKLDKHCYEGRTYADFLQFMSDNPDTPVVEMDSVEGKKGGKVLLTIFFRDSTFMLAFLREANTARSVTDIINGLYETLGRDTFCELFPVILTDRGTEFSNPNAIERDADGSLRCLVFYCNPSSPYEKGGIEVTHELIRRIIPKGTPFDQFQQKDIDLMMDHINSYKRKKLNNRSAHQLFSFLHGSDVLARLNAHCIEPNSIDLTPRLLKHST